MRCGGLLRRVGLWIWIFGVLGLGTLANPVRRTGDGQLNERSGRGGDLTMR